MDESDLERIRQWVRRQLSEGKPDDEILSLGVSYYLQYHPGESETIKNEIKAVIDERNAEVAQTLESISHVERKASEILESGTVLEFFKETYKTLHSGDTEILEIVTLAGACASSVTTTGIQPGFSGIKGAGKTSGARAALHLWPDECVVDGGMSNKALFYDKSLQAGCVGFRDGKYLPEDLQQTIKAAMSCFQAGAIYRSVGKDPTGKGLVALKLKIPPRTIFLFTSIDDSGDSELLDRQYKLSLQPDKKKKIARVKFLQERLVEGRESLPVTSEVQICREILRNIKEHVFRVKIPFSLRLIFSNVDNMRDIEQFCDFIQSVSILNYPNRNPTFENGITIIEASEEDFYTACRIFTTSEDTRQYKLTKLERCLLDWICEQPIIKAYHGISESDICKDFGIEQGISRGTIRRLLYGKDGDGGLCNKVPGVWMQKEQSGDTNHRNTFNAIYANPALKSNLSDYIAFATLLPEDSAPDTLVSSDRDLVEVEP